MLFVKTTMQSARRVLKECIRGALKRIEAKALFFVISRADCERKLFYTAFPMLNYLRILPYTYVGTLFHVYKVATLGIIAEIFVQSNNVTTL